MPIMTAKTRANKGLLINGRRRVCTKSGKEEEKVDDLRGSSMRVGNLEELINDNHAIVSSSVGPEYCPLLIRISWKLFSCIIR